jgi:predicted Zn-dependent protease
VLLPRVAVIVVALAMAGWLAAAYPGARDEARARALLGQGASPARLSAAEQRHAFALLRSARRVRPDGTAVQLESSLLTLTGRKAQAATLLRALLRREPDNVTAWTLLAFADPKAIPQARARQRALAPPVR